ncbi:MAG: hypothetical protein M3Y81_19560 [Chloroflexota bacterium]|nr:hypothetical protein [Chloroflexota bacterium]
MKLKNILVMLPLFLLAACGTMNASQDSTSGPSALHVVRTSSNRYAKHLTSFDRTVTDATTVQQLYTAAYALPAAKGVYNCPKDLGLVYHLTFLRNSTSIQQMDLQATYCQFLEIGNKDARETDVHFITLFTKTIGLPSLIPSY